MPPWCNLPCASVRLLSREACVGHERNPGFQISHCTVASVSLMGKTCIGNNKKKCFNLSFLTSKALAKEPPDVSCAHCQQVRNHTVLARAIVFTQQNVTLEQPAEARYITDYPTCRPRGVSFGNGVGFAFACLRASAFPHCTEAMHGSLACVREWRKKFLYRFK